ncbi:hypothetical protein EJ04DRAFT_595314 [Polyplosphaeria fusca]|uniref:Clavaminate synthase-like protein n=1 Tax=Polyplosphaeria fusca TaxID=682080 RepID=A0A9P4UT07_9PLEO|nr:hypothetical protein EJ04DRAFT_595314 [Polyplosphaeria fusca]
MAGVAAPVKPSSRDNFSISTFISRLRSKRTRKSKTLPRAREIPITSPLPLVHPHHQPLLPNLGWTTVTFPQPAPHASSHDPSTSAPASSAPPDKHPIQAAYEDLFAASATFFSLPDTEKSKWKTRLGSEEGWSSIPGEKEFITLRTLAYTPDVLREPAKRFWDLMGEYMTTCLGRVEQNLSMDEGALSRFVGPCGTMQTEEEHRTATMVRLFRYEGWEEKVVAEAHADLGLLSFVVGRVPGLEVWGGDGQGWRAVEREYEGAGEACGTLLGGRMLERFSNGGVRAGGHRVVSYGAPEMKGEGEKRYRFSIVFVLRAHEEVLVDSEMLETGVTGKWERPVRGVTAGEVYAEIRGAHFNINTGVQERELQRRKLEAKKTGGGGK